MLCMQQKVSLVVMRSPAQQRTLHPFMRLCMQGGVHLHRRDRAARLHFCLQVPATPVRMP